MISHDSGAIILFTHAHLQGTAPFDLEPDRFSEYLLCAAHFFVGHRLSPDVPNSLDYCPMIGILHLSQVRQLSERR